jgi:pimeloyl-ACP methyl ester carboxylesterase
VVVLVHGLAGSAASWEPVLVEFDRRGHHRRVLAPDLIGDGQVSGTGGGRATGAGTADHSLGGYATQLRDLLAALGHPRVTVVGHSFGGGIAMQFAYMFPQACDRLVLVDSGGLGREVSPLLRAVATPGAEWVLPLMARAGMMAAWGWLAGTTHGTGLPHLTPSQQQAARAFGSLARPAARDAFIHTARSVIDLTGQRVSGLDKLYLTAGVPTLIVWGALDPIIPLAHGRRAAELLAGSRLVVFETAGHFPHCDQPAGFTDALIEFLDATAPARIDPDAFAARLAQHPYTDHTEAS